MKYYLSSYNFGDNIDDLKRLIPKNNKIGHINNAQDCLGYDVERTKKSQQDQMEYLNSIGFESESLDLKTYFHNTEALRDKISGLGALWVSGGNAFVLRMAMRLSGFDIIFEELKTRGDFLYAGYSAGICVLSKSLKAIDRVDDPKNFPYPEITRPIYEGLGVFDYTLMPHYDSNHFESEAIGKEIQRCIDNKWLFKALRDGEVIIIDK